MNTFDFTSVPLVGNIMSITGISDGWIVCCIIAAVLAVVFLIGWIRSAAKGRAARREAAALQEEVVGLQALTTLPPLHEGSWDYGQNEDPGSSLVFASTKELKHRKQMASAASQAPSAPARQNTQQTTPAASASSAHKVTAAANAPVAPADTAGNVTAQVHEAIFASVTNGHLKGAAGQNAKGKTGRKGGKGSIKAEDLPSMDVAHKPKKAAPKKSAAKKAGSGDASLSSRIPRL